MRSWRPPRAMSWLLVIALAASAPVLRRAQHGAPEQPPRPTRPQPPPWAADTMLAAAAWIVAPRLERDPFAWAPAPRRSARRAAPAPAIAEDTSPPAVPRVQILLLDPQRPLAMMNNQRVAVGDTIAGYRVEGIDAGGVTLERHGVRVTARP